MYVGLSCILSLSVLFPPPLSSQHQEFSSFSTFLSVGVSLYSALHPSAASLSVFIIDQGPPISTLKKTQPSGHAEE